MTEHDIAYRIGADRVALDTRHRSHDEAEIRLTAHWGDVQHAVVWGADFDGRDSYSNGGWGAVPELAITALREWADSKGVNIGHAKS